jgi:excisionase family DNA binding protein
MTDNIGTQPIKEALYPKPGNAVAETSIPEINEMTWLTYKQAALYTGWTVAYLRNLVSAGQIPVYGKQRVRRFRRDMLDLFLTNPDVAMRKFRQERNTHGN